MDSVCDCTPPDGHCDPVPLEPGGKAAVWKAGSGNTWRRLEEAAAARLELWPCLTCQGHVPAYLVPVLPGPIANSPQPDANPLSSQAPAASPQGESVACCEVRSEVTDHHRKQ